MTTWTGDDRVILRDMEEPDIDPWCNWLLPHQEWHRWDAPYYRKPSAADVEATRVRLHRAAQAGRPIAESPADAAAPGLPEEPPRRLVIAASDDPARLLGLVTWYWESEATNWPRMGIAVYDPEVRGRGLGTAALRLWTSLLFDHRGMKARDVVRLDYVTWSGNERMLAVGRRLGFSEEARFRRARVVEGEYYDSVVMGVLRSEWRFGLESVRD